MYIILGAGGQLAEAFVRLLTERNLKFVALSQEEADLAQAEELQLPLEGATAVLNCAAWTNVDGAEEQEAAATQVNGHAVGTLARMCKEANVPFVHYSTDYVFDGTGSSPIPVDQSRGALNAYGRSKVIGEDLLTQSGAQYLLIRTSWVYSPWGNNFVNTMKRLMAEKDELRVVNDQRGRPTHVTGLAERTLGLLDKGEFGTFHITDDGECSWFEFADKIREILGSSCKVSPCTTEEFPRPATRPAYGVLDTSKVDALLGKAVPYEERLRSFLA